MSTSPLTLRAILEYLYELVSKGMENSDAFHQAHDEYICSLISTLDKDQIKDAIKYLNSHSIGSLNISNMIEQLEGKL